MIVCANELIVLGEIKCIKGRITKKRNWFIFLFSFFRPVIEASTKPVHSSVKLRIGEAQGGTTRDYPIL